MKQLIRRLSRVADSSDQYILLRSDSRRPRRLFTADAITKSSARRSANSKPVPEGHVPVYVGDEMERFVVSTELFNHPVFIGLLNKSAQEYGYGQKGVLRIPCHALVFERVIEALRLGLESRDLQDLIGASSSDEVF